MCDDKSIEEKIINEYKLGIYITVICEKYNLTRNNVYVILKKNNVKISNYRLQLIIGKKFNKLTVISIAESKNGKVKLNCLCDCGSYCIITKSDIISGHSKSCGCLIGSSPENIKISIARKVFKDDYSDGNLIFDDFLKLSQQNCFYCGVGPSNRRKNGYKRRKDIHNGQADFIFNGLDRVDNSLKHDIENIVTCCYLCNKSKSDLSYQKFIDHIFKIYLNLQSKNFIIEPINLSFNYETTNGIIFSNIQKGVSKYTPLGSSISNVHSIYKSHDRRMNRENNIPICHFYELTQLNCFYCNGAPQNKTSVSNPNCSDIRRNSSIFIYNGIDRIDSSKGHTLDNSVTSCFTCNRMKSNYEISGFIDWVTKIYTNLHKNK